MSQPRAGRSAAPERPPLPEQTSVLAVQFLIPVFDRQGRRYARSVHTQLRHDLNEKFGGWSLAAKRPLQGAWRNPESGEVEYDESWRYEVGIDSLRLHELDEYLGELAHRLDQKALWRIAYAGGSGRAVPARQPESR